MFYRFARLRSTIFTPDLAPTTLVQARTTSDIWAELSIPLAATPQSRRVLAAPFHQPRYGRGSRLQPLSTCRTSIPSTRLLIAGSPVAARGGAARTRRLPALIPPAWLRAATPFPERRPIRRKRRTTQPPVPHRSL